MDEVDGPRGEAGHLGEDAILALEVVGRLEVLGVDGEERVLMLVCLLYTCLPKIVQP